MSDDGSEYVSNHDRGAFGKLLAEAKALGAVELTFNVYLNADDEERRWSAESLYYFAGCGRPAVTEGRTGEEALRRLVEKLRG